MYFIQDECSFVSLRDVERAMIVFEYLYGMIDILSPLMDEWANGEHRHVDNEDEDMVRKSLHEEATIISTSRYSKTSNLREEAFRGSTDY